MVVPGGRPDPPTVASMRASGLALGFQVPVEEPLILMFVEALSVLVLPPTPPVGTQAGLVGLSDWLRSKDAIAPDTQALLGSVSATFALSGGPATVTVTPELPVIVVNSFPTSESASLT